MSELNQDVKNSRQQFYQHISGQNLTLCGSRCTARCRQHRTHIARLRTGTIREIRPLLLESGDLIGAKEAIRRVLVLETQCCADSLQSPQRCTQDCS